MNTKLKTHGYKTAEAISRREAFRTNGALRAETDEPAFFSWTGGRLNEDELTQWYKDRDRIIYCVYSYATPIAWVTNDGTVYKVKQKFSATTTKHQGLLYLLKGADHE